MRLFFIGWADEEKELADLVFDLQKSGHDIVYWSRQNNTFQVDESRFPDTIFHAYEDAVEAIPPKKVTTHFDPPSEGLLAQLHECESMVLTMMNKKYHAMPLNERKHLYYRFVSYWDGILRLHKPEGIIFPAPPHALYDYVLYSLAKLHGIGTLMLERPVVADRLLPLTDYTKGNMSIRDFMASSDGKKVNVADLSDDIRTYFERETKIDADRSPSYHAETLRDYSLGKRAVRKFALVYRTMKDGSFVRRAVNYVGKKFSENIKDEYNSVARKPQLDTPFVYAALSFQQEASTSPLGGVFVDQLLMIETLASALPDGWTLYVKEHPSQWLPGGSNFSQYRYPGFYKAIAAIRNVTLVPIETDTFALTRRSKAVATVTGTVGWEAVLRGKRSLYFGYPWYMYCPGTYRVHDSSSARAAIREIELEGSVSKDDVLKFLYAFDRASIKGYRGTYKGEQSSVTPQENKDHIRGVLESFFSEVANTKSS